MAGKIAGSTTEIKVDGRSPDKPVKLLANLTKVAPGVTAAVKCRVTQMLSPKLNGFDDPFVYVNLIFGVGAPVSVTLKSAGNKDEELTVIGVSTDETVPMAPSSIMIDKSLVLKVRDGLVSFFMHICVVALLPSANIEGFTVYCTAVGTSALTKCCTGTTDSISTRNNNLTIRFLFIKGPPAHQELGVRSETN